MPSMPLAGAYPAQRIRVSGTYQGTVSISSTLSSGKYLGVLADEVEFIGS